MFVTAIRIARDGYCSGYSTRADPSKPFRATVEVHGVSGKIELLLDADMSARIVAIIADEVCAASRATAEAMTAEVLTALPAAA